MRHVTPPRRRSASTVRTQPSGGNDPTATRTAAAIGMPGDNYFQPALGLDSLRGGCESRPAGARRYVLRLAVIMVGDNANNAINSILTRSAVVATAAAVTRFVSGAAASTPSMCTCACRLQGLMRESPTDIRLSGRRTVSGSSRRPSTTYGGSPLAPSRWSYGRLNGPRMSSRRTGSGSFHPRPPSDVAASNVRLDEVHAASRGGVDGTTTSESAGNTDRKQGKATLSPRPSSHHWPRTVRPRRRTTRKRFSSLAESCRSVNCMDRSTSRNEGTRKT